MFVIPFKRASRCRDPGGLKVKVSPVATIIIKLLGTIKLFIGNIVISIKVGVLNFPGPARLSIKQYSNKYCSMSTEISWPNRVVHKAK